MNFKNLTLSLVHLKLGLSVVALAQMFGCAAVTQVGALVLENPFTIVDIGGYIGTGKGTSEQALSQVTRKDCAFRYIVLEGVVCKDGNDKMSDDNKIYNQSKVQAARTPNSPMASYPPKLKNKVKVNPDETIPRHLDPRKNRGRRLIKRPWPPGSD